MNVSIVSPRRKEYCDEEVIESPTTPSSTPLMPSSSFPSPSSQEQVPILLEFDESSFDEISPRRKGSRKGRLYSVSRYTTSCIAFIALIILSYIFITKEFTNVHIKSSLSRLRKKADPAIDITDNEPKSSPSPSVHKTHPPSSNLSSKSIIKPSASSSAQASPHPSSRPTVKPSAKPIVAPHSTSQDQNSTEEMMMEIVVENNDSVKFEDNTNKAIKVNNENKEKKKKNLVIHVGPQKTGSTTLQEAWTKPYGLISESLIDDNYYYHYINAYQGFFDCDLGKFGGYHNCTAASKLKDIIKNAVNSGKNLLLSDENLDDQFPAALRDVIDENEWDVTIIVVYRRIHQWLTSWYNQINKTTNKDSKGNVLLNDNDIPYRVEHTNWPDEGGQHIPSFTTWYKEFTRYWDHSELVSKHRSISFMNAYRPYFNNIVVHNMHQDGDLVTNFMCDSVPDAIHCCNRMKNLGQASRDNMSINLDYDILAVKARENGFITNSFLSRKEVVFAIENFIESTGKLIPRTCDKNMINEIQRWLFDSEEAMFNESLSDQRAQDLEETFESYVEKGKLCDADFDQVFSDIQWLNFFKNLDHRPHLVIHVGPQKTGSTTLQHVWAAPEELGNVLRQDNFLYEYINIHRGTFDCDINGDNYSNCKASNKLKQILAKASEDRKHILVSDENLNERYARALRDAIDDRKFRVKIIVVYRRIHEWLPSWYSQLNKNTVMDSNGNLLQDENGLAYSEPHTHWPSEGGLRIPNFSDWYQHFVRQFAPHDLGPNHPSVHFMNVYKLLFDRVTIYDMNQEGDLVTNFMCQMIPEAKRTCNHLKQGMTLPLSNPSVNVEHDILSVQAYENGLIDKKLTRSMVVSEVTKYVKESGKVLSRRCDNGLIDQIRGWLLDSEKIMFPDKWSSDSRDALEETFGSFSSTGKLCDIDVENILSDDYWIRFFSSLGKSRSLLKSQDWLKSFMSYFENY